MDKKDIELIKKHIKYLTHYTDEKGFNEIIKSGFLKKGPRFDVAMVSTFPSTWEDMNMKSMISLTGKELEHALNKNFNISMCHDRGIILLFDPKMLWLEKYYYFSIGDCYGMPTTTSYISKPLQKRIPHMSRDNDYKMYKIFMEFKNMTQNEFFKLEDILNNLSFWPEIGFYHNIKIKKYLIGVIIPSFHYDLFDFVEKYNPNLEIFSCDDNGIKKVD